MAEVRLLSPTTQRRIARSRDRVEIARLPIATGVSTAYNGAMTSPTDMTPAQIDQQLADIGLLLAKTDARLASARDHIRHIAGQRRNYSGQWSGGSYDDAFEFCLDNPDHYDVRYGYRNTAGAALEDLANLENYRFNLREQERPYAAEFTARGGWNRYFLVTNGNGHVHRGMDCSTCRWTTRYAWLIELADCDETAMVAEYGEQACTVCFPNAPTFKGFGDGTSAYARKVQADRDAKQAEKDSRAAAKAAKLLDSPVRDHHGLRVETVAAAKQALRDAVGGYYPNADDRETMRAALTLKGFTVEELDTIEAKAMKRGKR